MKSRSLLYICGFLLWGAATAASAQGKPVYKSGDFSFTPILDARLRYESVDQNNALSDAEAVTARLRAGAELGWGGFRLLGETETTVSLDDQYNSTTNGNSRYSTVPDPETFEINRLQLQYTGLDKTKLTFGRQRINIDDQRWVGSVGWRQDEQTFDAVRIESSALGPISLDAAYSNSERTIFGEDAGQRAAFDGDFYFAGAGMKFGPFAAKGFAYLLDQSEAARLSFSSQSYGLRVTGAAPIAGRTKLTIAASYARQSNWRDNPTHYAADYIAVELGTNLAGLGLSGGYEQLGSDNGLAAVQTPFATLHKFNGWADVFLTTPPKGLRDYYLTAAYKFSGVKLLPGLNANLAYHRFDSDFGGVKYGDEWDASVGFKVGKTAVLAKYAGYGADRFGVDTDKVWLQLEWSY